MQDKLSAEHWPWEEIRPVIDCVITHLSQLKELFKQHFEEFDPPLSSDEIINRLKIMHLPDAIIYASDLIYLHESIHELRDMLSLYDRRN